MEDFKKAFEALKKANTKGPYYFINPNGKGLLTRDEKVVGT